MAIVIHGIVICGFGCPLHMNCVQNLLSADISFVYARILPFFEKEKILNHKD